MTPILASSAPPQERSPHAWLPRRGLYVLTRDEPDTDRLVQDVRAAIAGGACMVQYRNKRAAAELRAQQAAALLQVCRASHVPLVINDDVALAQSVNADGVHLGAQDDAPSEARRLLGPGAIIGVSCYDDLERAEAAATAGASYLAFGAFHVSSTKPHASRASLETLRQAARFALPRVAIGGILPENAEALLNAGADFLAVSAAVFADPDPFAAATRFHSLFEN